MLVAELRLEGLDETRASDAADGTSMTAPAHTESSAEADAARQAPHDAAGAVRASTERHGEAPVTVGATEADFRRPHWELSAEEQAAHDRATWPPARGHAISLACFGCAESSAQEPEKSAQRRVHASLVQKCDELKAGDECLCLDPRDGQQWLATIMKMTENHALVHYKGWSKSTDSWVTRDKLALKPSPQVLERIKLYNDHSKLRQAGTPKNQLSSTHLRLTEAAAPAKQPGAEALEGHEMRSRLRGVEMCRPPSTRCPNGMWRAIQFVGNRKSEIGNVFASKEEAAEARRKRLYPERSPTKGGAPGKAKQGADDDTTEPTVSGTSTGLVTGRNISEGGALGNRVEVDMGPRRRSGTVVAWIGAKALYQIRLDGTGDLLHLPIPHKRIVLNKTNVTHKPSVTTKAFGAVVAMECNDDDRCYVLDLLGGPATSDEMQDVCDTLPHEHVVGANALQLARLKYLAKSCDAHGIDVSPAAVTGTMEEVCFGLQVALHHAQRPGSSTDEEKAAVDKKGQRIPCDDDEKRIFSGVRLRTSGSREEREFNKWEAFIRIGGQDYILGHFSYKVEAARAWDMAARKLLPRSACAAAARKTSALDTTAQNLSDSDTFLPSKELEATLMRITAMVSTCDGYRTVPPAANNPNAIYAANGGCGYIPLPAVAAGAVGHTDVQQGGTGQKDKKETRKKDSAKALKPKQEGERRSSRLIEPAQAAIALNKGRLPAKAETIKRSLLQSNADLPARAGTCRQVRIAPRGRPPQRCQQRQSLHLPGGAESCASVTAPTMPWKNTGEASSSDSKMPSMATPNTLSDTAESCDTATNTLSTDSTVDSADNSIAAVPDPMATSGQHVKPLRKPASKAPRVLPKGWVLEPGPVDADCEGADKPLSEKRVRKRKLPFGMEEADADAPASPSSRELLRQKIIKSTAANRAAGAAIPSASRDESAGIGCADGDGERRGRRKSDNGQKPGGQKGRVRGVGRAVNVVGGAWPAYTLKGARCEVLWEEDWWDAIVRKRNGCFLQVHYDGGTAEEDEWIHGEAHDVCLPYTYLHTYTHTFTYTHLHTHTHTTHTHTHLHTLYTYTLHTLTRTQRKRMGRTHPRTYA